MREVPQRLASPSEDTPKGKVTVGYSFKTKSHDRYRIVLVTVSVRKLSVAS